MIVDVTELIERLKNFKSRLYQDSCYNITKHDEDDFLLAVIISVLETVDKKYSE